MMAQKIYLIVLIGLFTSCCATKNSKPQISDSVKVEKAMNKSLKKYHRSY